jgi:tetratricopeptide (TPR) repeat protein
MTWRFLVLIALVSAIFLGKESPILAETADRAESLEEISPKLAQAMSANDYFYRGNKKYDLEDYYGAISEYNEAIRINRNFADAYSNRAVAKSASGDKKGAIKDYNEAIRINRNFADAYFNRGLAKDELGDKQGAIADYSEAIRIKPNYNYEAYYNRGLARYELGDDMQGAISDFTEAINVKPYLSSRGGLLPNLVSAYYSRGKVRVALGDSQGAIADFTEAIDDIRLPRISMYTFISMIYYNRGVEKGKLRDIKGAISDYNESIRLNPNFALAYYNRGLIQEGEKQKILADFRKASELFKQQGNTEWYNKSRDRIKELGG